MKRNQFQKANDSEPKLRPPFLKLWALLLPIAAVALVIGLYLIPKPSSPQIVTETQPPAPRSPISPISPLTNAITVSSSDSDHFAALIRKGQKLYDGQDYKGAAQVFSDAITVDPDNPVAYDARGTAYAELDSFDQALADYDTAIELRPDFAQPYYNRARIYRLLGEYEKAFSDLHKSIELGADVFGYRANGYMGLIWYELGEYNEALEAFEASISYDNTKADAYYFRGETHTFLEDYDAAVVDYKTAVDRFPNYPEAYQSLGYAYLKIGQFDKAIEVLNKALKISPQSPTPHFYLMLVYLATSNLDNATAEASQATVSFATLPQEEQEFIYNRIQADLKTFARENPDKTEDVESIISVLGKIENDIPSED